MQQLHQPAIVKGVRVVRLPLDGLLETRHRLVEPSLLFEDRPEVVEVVLVRMDRDGLPHQPLRVGVSDLERDDPEHGE